MKHSRDYVEVRRNEGNPPLSEAAEELKLLIENTIDSSNQFFIDNGYILLPPEYEAKLLKIVPYSEYRQVLKWCERYKWRLITVSMTDSPSEPNRYGLIAF